MSKEILCTIGPSSLNQGVLTRMNELAVTLLRINMSHTSTYDLPDTIRFIQEFSDKPICIDTEGAQIRTGKMAEGSIALSEGSFLEIPRKKILGNTHQINLEAPATVGGQGQLSPIWRPCWFQISARIIGQLLGLGAV